MKSDNFRRYSILIIVFAVTVLVLILNSYSKEKHSTDMYDYYIENTYEETNVTNMVSAIYISYRIFDTLFEALLLAAAVTAVIYFASPWDKHKEEGNG